MTCAIVIVTKNRRDELRVALRSAVAQTAPAEILVIDDGSTDGTPEMVRSEFPQARLHRCAESRGLIVRRNEAARLTGADIIVSIDDDAEFVSRQTVEQTLADFDDPLVGAVAIPYVEPNKSVRVLQQPPERHGCWLTDSFIGTAHALRRDVFLQVGGYRDDLVHQGEESDFCIRMLSAGHVVRLRRGDPIHHYESPKRDPARMDFYGPRNLVWYGWRNVPAPFVLFHLGVSTARCASLTFAPNRLGVRLRGLLAGYAGMRLADRHPVPQRVFRLMRSLARAPRPMDAVRRLLS